MSRGKYAPLPKRWRFGYEYGQESIHIVTTAADCDRRYLWGPETLAHGHKPPHGFSRQPESRSFALLVQLLMCSDKSRSILTLDYAQRAQTYKAGTPLIEVERIHHHEGLARVLWYKHAETQARTHHLPGSWPMKLLPHGPQKIANSVLLEAVPQAWGHDKGSPCRLLDAQNHMVPFSTCHVKRPHLG